MADLASARVKNAINEMIENIDKSCMRRMQVSDLKICCLALSLIQSNVLHVKYQITEHRPILIVETIACFDSSSMIRGR